MVHGLGDVEPSLQHDPAYGTGAEGKTRRRRELVLTTCVRRAGGSSVRGRQRTGRCRWRSPPSSRSTTTSAVVAAVVRDLRQRYGEDYRVLRATSGQEALEILADQLLKDRPVAAVVSDQRMPGMTGIEVLREVREQSPDSKLLLLTAYADTDVAIRAINDIALDYYLMKPWDPPEDRLYPVLDELLGDWAHGHPDRDSEVRVVGHRWSERTVEVKTFLTHNHVPYRWLEVGDAGSATRRPGCSRSRRRGADDLPVVALPDGAALRSPTTVELAGALGLRTRADAAALRPLHRRRRTRRPRRCGVRRQRGARRPWSSSATHRAARPGRARPSRTTSASPRGCPARTSPTARSPRRGASAPRWCWRATSSGSRRAARCAPCCSTARRTSRRARCWSPAACPTGVSDAPGLDEVVGRGIYYGASASEAAQTAGEDVYVVGAANSAGQAALNFAQLRGARRAGRARRLARGVHVAVPRRPDPRRAHVEVRLQTEVVGARGDGHLEAITLCDRAAGQRRGGRDQLGVRLHRRGPAHRVAGRGRLPRRPGLRAHRARPPGRRRRGRWSAAPSRWRPACPACSPPATYAVTR